MNYTSLFYLVAYVVVALFSMFVPALGRTYPRVAAVLQVLAALGIDLPRLAEGLRKLVMADAGPAAPAPTTPKDGPQQ